MPVATPTCSPTGSTPTAAPAPVWRPSSATSTAWAGSSRRWPMPAASARAAPPARSTPPPSSARPWPISARCSPTAGWTSPTSRRAPVPADPVGLGQIVTNLVGNATKFSEPGGSIEVVVQTHPGEARIAVVDHGTGAPPDRVDELFGRFARLGSTRRGLGLGLYLSRAIARRHGGDVVHEHTPGGGATFVVTLPLRMEER